MEVDYDYIIAGSGLAGLSLLYRLLLDKDLQKKTILVVDKVKKSDNDRTWCYWEQGESIFEDIVRHKWETLQFFSPAVAKTFSLKKYKYKMIQAGDFYRLVMEYAATFENVTFKTEAIINMDEKDGQAILITENKHYKGWFIFNSTALFLPEMNTQNTLLQHFMGWFIKADSPVFNEKIGTLMDFRLEQQHGATFMYVLPTSATEALIEFTLFSESTLEKEAYNFALKDYISSEIGIKNYKILHKEFGVIPMSLAQFSKTIKNSKRIVNIGTAGGFTKASTGYTFQFVQKNVSQIVELLKFQKPPIVGDSWKSKKYAWYDRTLLDVLLSKKVTGRDIFESLFRKNSPEKILSFLDNDSNFWEEFKIRNSVPLLPFMFSGIQQLLLKNKTKD
ncbi:lycopene cyclase family protein [Cyclobacterium sp. 1_MG-2023]|uniref:lycopene cyclase family protein n=1 Tax=Cyclobacterium sp. 1_MG-2023 TaxID=3062681 RepID=UPI0026E21010|nr:lycopene cyclase family protein [Cyclobacterium sp. 1_MG-2023]MDO6438069.1 lycopene cyclase family protein [Cyclobacterium sp. 1_MG-2023]